MSREYRQETENKYKEKCETLLASAPSYMHEFYMYMGSTREISTQYRYLADVMHFLEYEHDIIPECCDLTLAEMPVFLFDKLTSKDIIEYRNYLHDAKFLSNSTIKKTTASISSFYRFLNVEGYTKNNPLLNLETIKTNKKHIVKLDSELSLRLLSGILTNEYYLGIPQEIQDHFITKDDKKKAKYMLDDMKEPIKMPEKVKLRRSRVVLRNFAIVSLLLGSGLRVSELVGLDLTDINYRNNSLTIIKKGGDDTEVYFNDEIAKILKSYINCTPLPSEIADRYYRGKGEKKEGYSSLPNYPGRLSLNPKKNEKAVFLSTRGTRMTVRMVELMVKEMVKTFLPDFEDKDIFSPHKLRATCATRILTQTGDIQLAATQLNHKSITVTSQFYAELQKEQQKEKIKNLDVNNW